MSQSDILKSINILVVDDDAMVRSIVIEYLKRFGFVNIVEEKNGMRALKHVRDHEVPIDLIISDWEMPEIDGLTILKAVRNDPHRRDVKFMIVTSQSSHERVKVTQAIQSRVDAYIIKPFRGETFRQKIMEVLGLPVEKQTG